MIPELIYEKTLIKVNKNNTGANIALDLPRFVLLFNECKNRWVERNLKNRDSILIDNLYQTISNAKLLSPISTDVYCDFVLPDNFYQLAGATCVAKRGNCKRTLFTREVKNQNKQVLRYVSNQKPNFDYEWTFCSVQGENIRIYRTDFDILQADIEYYSVIPDIDIAGYIKIDGTSSTSIPLDIIADQYIDQIINLTAEEYMRNVQDQIGLQMAKDRTISEK
jgi:hypothetical protein